MVTGPSLQLHQDYGTISQQRSFVTGYLFIYFKMIFNLNLTSKIGSTFEHLVGDMAPYKLSIFIIIIIII